MKIAISCIYTLVFIAYAVLLSGKYSAFNISRFAWLGLSVVLSVILVIALPISIL